MSYMKRLATSIMDAPYPDKKKAMIELQIEQHLHNKLLFENMCPEAREILRDWLNTAQEESDRMIKFQEMSYEGLDCEVLEGDEE